MASSYIIYEGSHKYKLVASSTGRESYFFTNAPFNGWTMSSETWPPLSARIALGTGSAPASVAMVLQAIFVVNKAGSLIFYRKFVDSPPVVSQNDQLHLASTFHGCVHSSFSAPYPYLSSPYPSILLKSCANFLPPPRVACSSSSSNWRQSRRAMASASRRSRRRRTSCRPSGPRRACNSLSQPILAPRSSPSSWFVSFLRILSTGKRAETNAHFFVFVRRVERCLCPLCRLRDEEPVLRDRYADQMRSVGGVFEGGCRSL